MSEARSASPREPQAPTPASPRRLKPWERWSLVGGGVAAVLLVLGLGLGVLLGRAPRIVARIAAARLHRSVHIDGASSVRILPSGVEVTFRDAHIGRPSWAAPGDALSVGVGRVRFAWTSVLHLRPSATVMELDHPVIHLSRDRSGRPDWASGPDASALSQPLTVGRLKITDGRVLYDDAEHGTRLDATVSADPDAADGMGLHVDGGGVSQLGPWRISFRAPAVAFGDRRPYPMRLSLRQAPSRFDFAGELPPGLDIQHIHGVIDGSGADMHDLSRLMLVPFPHTAPYRISASLKREGSVFRLSQIRGRTGSSDVTGALTVSQEARGRRLEGAFTSPDLAMGDLMVLITAGQSGTGRPHKAGGGLIPDIKVNAAPLRKLTGAITFEAPHVQPAGGMAIRALKLKATFDHGRVGAAPLVLALPRGSTVWTIGLDTRTAVTGLDLDLALHDAATPDLFGASAAHAPLAARIDGRIRLRGSGATLHAAAAASSGSASLTGRGAVERTDAAVLGGDLRGAFASLLSHEKAAVRMNCLVGDFAVAGGKARASKLVFATSAGRVQGEGGVDLGAETLNFTLRGDPVHPGLVKPGTYVTVTGPLAHPHAELHQGGPGGMLKSLLSIVPKPGGADAPAGC